MNWNAADISTTIYSLIDPHRNCLCSNILFHSSGQLYGPSRKMFCRRWKKAGEQLYFIGPAGYIRYAFSSTLSGFTGHSVIPPITELAYREIGPQGEGGFNLYPQQELPGKEDFEIVVAKYKEDIAWTDALDRNVTIYSKHRDDHNFTMIENKGYEGGTYFHHIIQNYDRLAAKTLFLQGDPFAHSVIPFADYMIDQNPFVSGKSKEFSLDWSPRWTLPDQKIDRSVMEEFLTLISGNLNRSLYYFHAGAQFAVDRDKIRQRPKEYYERLFHLTQQPELTLARRRFDNHHIAYLFELFWQEVFAVEP